MKWLQWAVTLLLPCCPFSAVLKTRTPGLPSLDGESAWKQLTDPSEHLFKLNVKTGATEWYAEQAQNHGAAAPQSAGGVAVMPAITANAGAKQPETKPQAKKGEASETNWFAAHGWLDDWLGWGETVADPASQEVRDDVARDLGIRTQPPSEVVAVEARNTEKVVPQAHAANASPSSMEKPPSEMRTALAQQASQGLDERTSAAETEELLANIGRKPDVEQEAILNSEEELMLEEVSRVLHVLEDSQEKLVSHR
ncbi:unnamed protein product [Symbiodinium natans]|uniref:WW domain-containing protein n=1 Tax=Symbiodinium natans TaxID=878477 RepID=A0A812UAT6_9DINO|nr:unnamed protein product [Symbiodinium natans]